MVDFQSRDRGDTGTEDDASENEVDVREGTENGDGATAGEDADAAAEDGLGFAVVTIADGLAVEDDETGETVVDLLEATGATVVARNVISPGYDSVQSSAGRLAERRDVDAMVTIGSTGVEPDAVAIEATEPLFDKHLPGFGDLLRQFEYDRVGTATVADRSTAGMVGTVPVFAIPDDRDAARTATQRIIVPEAESLVDAARDATRPDDRP